ncbi:MAG: hypothetical protein ACKO68_09460 [Bacteroidota bacterium]
MSNIDDLFKKAIESQSEPYNPAAWEKLSNRLDAGIPPRKNPFVKWGLPGLAVLVSVAAIAYYNSESPIKKTQVSEVEQQNKTEQVVHNPETAKRVSNDQTSEKTKITDQNDVPLAQTSNLSEPEGATSEVHNSDNQTTKSKEQGSTETAVLQPAQIGKMEQESIQNIAPKLSENFTALVLPTCENDALDVQNANDFGIVLRSKEFEEKISSNTTKKIKLPVGNYEVVHSVSGVSLQNHAVVGVTSSEIVVGELYYNSGLPYRHASIKTENTVTAIASQETHVTCCSKEMEMLAFNKGNYTLSVETSNEMGCRGKSIETFYVAEDYNLLSVNAFEPLSQDSRKSTFIPFALTQRGTPFRMVVLDPSDGGIVFETTDALIPWDGIDKRTGKLADSNKAYVWKVNLSKPEPGEKSDYLGTVVRM